MKQISCLVYRGKKEESKHNVYCVILDSNNQRIFETQHAQKEFCLRSTLKPFQAAIGIKNGTHTKYKLTQKEIAITCASHHGEDKHIKTVDTILKKLQMTRKHLECGFHYPLNKKNRKRLYANPEERSYIYNNCSGKHVGILAHIKLKGLNPKGYTNHKHPIHQHINGYIETVAEQRSTEFAVDGCSLPTPYFPLITLAKMYQKLFTHKTPELQIIYNAMTKFPEMVSGKDGFDTIFMKSFNGKAISKGGAEGMRGLAMQTKKHGPISMALKIQDGGQRANDTACLSILNYIGAITPEENKTINQRINSTITNHNNIKTGKIICTI